MDQSGNQLKKCRYCSQPLEKEGDICRSCGYDAKTDTINQSFVEKKAVKTKGEKKSNTKSLLLTFFFLLAVFLITNNVFKEFDFSAIVSNIKQVFVKDKQASGKNSKAVRGNTKKSQTKGLIQNIFPEKTLEDKRKELFMVEGIAFDPVGKSFVLVNGEYFSEGDTFRNIKIEKINRNSITVSSGGQNKTLEVSQSMGFPKK